MTQEDKQLLLKDLCARLPYGVICDCLHSISGKATIVDVEDMTVYYTDCDEWESIEHCRPYLRRNTSMTEEEKKELWELLKTLGITAEVKRLDWLNAHHFDYRGLIEKGLALEAPEGMYK